jgi:hypothetical protein
MTSVYVASKLENWAAVQKFQKKLLDRGLTIPHDWAALAEREFVYGDQVSEDLAAVQLATVRSVSCLVLLTPGGRGAHVEFGCALGAGVPTVVALDGITLCIDFYRQATAVVTGWNAAVRAVLELTGKTQT